jgi:hypothetical protein
MNSRFVSIDSLYDASGVAERSTGLWRWYINITITILDIIYGLVFYFLKHVMDDVRTSQEAHYLSATGPTG